MPRIISLRTAAWTTAFIATAVVYAIFGPGSPVLANAFTWTLMVLLCAAFWGAVIFGAIWLARQSGLLGGNGRVNSKEDALALLKQRYANGEISRSEYFQIKHDLESDL